MARIRKAVIFKRYFLDFFEIQTIKVKKKISWTIDLIETIERVPDTYLKHIEGTEGLYEMRIQSGSNIFRIFCCFDEGKLVILMNGFQKKSPKTPASEITKALKIKQEYEKSR